MPMSQSVAYLGLGVMGFPMAGHLAAAGHKMTVFNRNKAKAESWVSKYGGRAAATPEEAGREVELLFLRVSADKDVRLVLTGEDGAINGLARGAVIIDNTTTSAVVAREMAEAAAVRGVH